MRSMVLAFATLVLVLAAMPVHAKFDLWEMQDWSRRAESCGEDYQFIAAHSFEDRVPDFLEALVGSARQEGANEAQIAMIVEAFQEGRRIAINEGQTKENWTIDDEEMMEYHWENVSNYLEKIEERCKL